MLDLRHLKNSSINGYRLIKRMEMNSLKCSNQLCKTETIKWASVLTDWRFMARKIRRLPIKKMLSDAWVLNC